MTFNLVPLLGADNAEVYLRLQGVPYVGSITLGKFKVPFGLDFLTSSLGIPLQERALTQAFVPGREIGLRVGTPLLGQPFQHGYHLCSEIGSRYAFSALLRSPFRRLFLQISRVLLLSRPIHPCGELCAFAQ